MLLWFSTQCCDRAARFLDTIWFLAFLSNQQYRMVFSERDWSATPKMEERKGEKTSLGTANMSVNLASWHTDGAWGAYTGY